jgi:hypothetical protein
MSGVIRRTLLALTVALPLASWAGLNAAEPQKILMIGNSLTFCWGIPAILDHLAAAANHKLAITAHTTPGKTLTWHWTNPQMPGGLTAAQEIARGGYDLVILQELSPILVGKPGQDEFTRIVPEYVKAIRKASMRPLIYMAHPTAKEVDPTRFRRIAAAYSQEAEQLGIPCAPVALAFVRCNEKYPTLALMDPQTDRKYGSGTMATHQSPFGSYLAACMLYAAIYRQSPVGIGFHSAFKSFNGFNADAKTEFPIEAADATVAQEIAWQVWQEYTQKHP